MGTATLRHSQNCGVAPRIPQGPVPHLSSCGAGMPGVQLLLGPRQEQRGLGMWLLCPGGLQHCSCSHHRNKTDFFFQWVSAGLLQSQGQLQPESRGRGVGSSLGKQGNWGLVVGQGALHSLLGLQAPLSGKCPPSLPLQDGAGPRPLLPAALPPRAGETTHSAVLTPPCPKGAPTAASLGLYGVEEAGGSSEEGLEEARGLPQLSLSRSTKQILPGQPQAPRHGQFERFIVWQSCYSHLLSSGGEAAPAWPQHGTAVSRGAAGAADVSELALEESRPGPLAAPPPCAGSGRVAGHGCGPVPPSSVGWHRGVTGLLTSCKKVFLNTTESRV